MYEINYKGVMYNIGHIVNSYNNLRASSGPEVKARPGSSTGDPVRSPVGKIP